MHCCSRGRFLYISLSVLVFLLSPCPLAPVACPLVPHVPLVPLSPLFVPLPLSLLSPVPLICPLVPLVPLVPFVHLSPSLVPPSCALVPLACFPVYNVFLACCPLFYKFPFPCGLLYPRCFMAPLSPLSPCIVITHFSSMIMYTRREERETERK